MYKCEKCEKITLEPFGSSRFCSKRCANSRKWSKEHKKKISNLAKKNFFLLYKNSNGTISRRKLKYCLFCQKEFLEKRKNSNQKYCSLGCYSEHTRRDQYLNKNRGQNLGRGFGKSGWYKGTWCDSSWELAWVIYQIEHGNKFERNNKSFIYLSGGRERRFFPDFLVNEEFIEIKGFEHFERWKDKQRDFPKDKKIRFLFWKDLQSEFMYVIERYGRDFIRLYDGKKYEKRKNRCLVCKEPAVNVFCSRICSAIENRKLRKGFENQYNKAKTLSALSKNGPIV